MEIDIVETDEATMLPPECIRKNGEPSALKLDGTHRIAAGGYQGAKQGRWGRNTLTRVSRLAREHFGKKWEAAVAFYVYECGYESVLREYLRNHTPSEFSELRALFAYCKNISNVIACKYLTFAKVVEKLNFISDYQRVIKKRKKS